MDAIFFHPRLLTAQGQLPKQLTNMSCLSTWVEAYWETTRVEYLVPDKKEKKDTLQQFF